MIISKTNLSFKVIKSTLSSLIVSALYRNKTLLCICDFSVITKRRTGLSSRQLKDAIEKCDLDRLPGEYAGLLLNYMPTKEEVSLSEV